MRRMRSLSYHLSSNSPMNRTFAIHLSPCRSTSVIFYISSTQMLAESLQQIISLATFTGSFVIFILGRSSVMFISTSCVTRLLYSTYGSSWLQIRYSYLLLSTSDSGSAILLVQLSMREILLSLFFRTGCVFDYFDVFLRQFTSFLDLPCCLLLSSYLQIMSATLWR